MANKNQTKQLWEIVIIGEDYTHLCTIFRGTQVQAEIYHKMMYDVKATTLRPHQVLDLDKIELVADSDEITFKGIEGEDLVRLVVIDDEFFVWDEDCDDIVDDGLISHEELLRFPTFVPLAICSECKGSKITTTQDCSMGSASVCCGGCEQQVECQCDDVIYPFIED